MRMRGYIPNGESAMLKTRMFRSIPWILCALAVGGWVGREVHWHILQSRQLELRKLVAAVQRAHDDAAEGAAVSKLASWASENHVIVCIAAFSHDSANPVDVSTATTMPARDIVFEITFVAHGRGVADETYQMTFRRPEHVTRLMME